MNLLQTALANSANLRATDAATKEAARLEYVAIVAGLHAAFSEYQRDVSQMQLVGDYGKPMPVRGEFSREIKVSYGLNVRLGSDVSPQYLVLSIARREAGMPPQATLTLRRTYPFENQTLATFDGFTPAEHLLKAFFEALMPHVWHAKTTRKEAPAQQDTVQEHESLQ